MATVLLAAAGSPIGSGVGGSFLGLSGAVIGRAIGATIGRSIDQRLLGSGSEAVSLGKVENFRISGASYGAPIKKIWGRARVAGQVIWSSRFAENVRTTSSGAGGGGKGAPRNATTTSTFYYTVSVAIALCEGVAESVGRVWANGIEIPIDSLQMRFYSGDELQLPDPKIAAVEGPDAAPSYRGIAYVVIEDLQLGEFGNRVPQFSFEVIRNLRAEVDSNPKCMADVVRAVALIPGTGEYSLATTQVHFAHAPGKKTSANVHTVQRKSDFEVAIQQLEKELPRCEAVSLVVSWFGNDLRCSQCEIKPKVEQNIQDAANMPWRVSGSVRANAEVVPQVSGRPIYGGTPSDQSVIEAITYLRDSGKEVMFYPFILMDQLSGNGLSDPWSEGDDQPALPWRGRITLSQAPGRSGTTYGSSAAAAEVNAFLGSASPSDFLASGSTVTYAGPASWGYRRFILHYAHLCALAGGVDTFCIGSELRALTQIRAAGTIFPMVDGLRQLAGEVKAILGESTKVTYAADWSEYFGTHSGSDLIYHLDPLWADESIDFIGIDNYMPISDWNDSARIRAGGGSIYDLEYLESNILGGEGYDWYYETPEAASLGYRTAIRDTAYGEDWVFRYKDLPSWWSNLHFNRIDGVADSMATDWVPQSKPIRFTEIGCPAIDLGTNEPNKFVDEGSSESAFPRGSNGSPDEYIQLRYLLAMDRFWRRAENNPNSSAYAGRMLDVDRSHVWAWDCRPYPEYPANTSAWSDGDNYRLGHWINGRSSHQQLAAVVEDIMDGQGIRPSSGNLHGVVRGFDVDSTASGRSMLQTLMTAYDFQIYDYCGEVVAESSAAAPNLAVDLADTVDDRARPQQELRRDVRTETVDRVRISFYEAGGDFETAVSEASLGFDGDGKVSGEEWPLLLDPDEADSGAERLVARSWIGRNQTSIGLGFSHAHLRLATRIEYDGATYRILTLEDSAILSAEAIKVDDRANGTAKRRRRTTRRQSPAAPTPVTAVLMDLPLLRGDEVAHAPYLAVAANPWPGPVSIWDASVGSAFALNSEVVSPAIIGESLNSLQSYRSDLWDRGSKLIVRIGLGTLSSVTEEAVLGGSNVAVIGGPEIDRFEILQFTNATLIAEDTYEISGLLRGLAGTDAISPLSWPVGSRIVFLETGVQQIELPIALVGLERQYRVGASALGYLDQNVVFFSEAFSGVGLRPYSVQHLRAEIDSSGDLGVGWVRRTRIGGDSWELADVPIGEDSERYIVNVVSGDVNVRSEIVTGAQWSYSVADQISDGVAVPYRIDVSQVSSLFGPGPSASITIGL